MRAAIRLRVRCFPLKSGVTALICSRCPAIRAIRSWSLRASMFLNVSGVRCGICLLLASPHALGSGGWWGGWLSTTRPAGSLVDDPLCLHVGDCLGSRPLDRLLFGQGGDLGAHFAVVHVDRRLSRHQATAEPALRSVGVLVPHLLAPLARRRPLARSIAVGAVDWLVR